MSQAKRQAAVFSYSGVLADAVAAGVTVSAPAGSLVFGGVVPSTSTGINVQAPAGTLVLTGLLPSAETGASVQTPAGSLVLNGLLPGITADVYGDISTAGATNGSLSLSSISDIEGMAFSSDGTKLYVVSSSTDLVHQFPLTTPGDVRTAGAQEASLNISSVETQPTGVTINDAGTKLCIVGAANNTIYQYPLATAKQLWSAGASDANYAVTGETANAGDVTFNHDGSKICIVDIGTRIVYQYPLSTPGDLSSITATDASFSLAGTADVVHGIAFNHDGTKLCAVEDTTVDEIIQYPLSTAGNINSAGVSDASLNVNAESTSSRCVKFNHDGSAICVFDGPTRTIYQYPLIADPDTYVVAPVGALNFTALLPSSSTGVNTQAPAGTLTLTGLLPGAETGVVVSTPAASLNLTGLLPTASTGTSVTAPSATITVSGFLPSTATGISVQAPAGALTLTGLLPSAETGVNLQAPAGAITLTGELPFLGAGTAVTPPVGALTLTGLLPATLTGATTQAPVGALALTGVLPTMVTGVSLEAPAGSLVLTGLLAQPTTATSVSAPVGSITLTGLVPAPGTGARTEVPSATLNFTGLAPIGFADSAMVFWGPTSEVFSPSFISVTLPDDSSTGIDSQDILVAPAGQSTITAPAGQAELIAPEYSRRLH